MAAELSSVAEGKEKLTSKHSSQQRLRSVLQPDEHKRAEKRVAAEHAESREKAREHKKKDTSEERREQKKADTGATAMGKEKGEQVICWVVSCVKFWWRCGHCKNKLSVCEQKRTGMGAQTVYAAKAGKTAMAQEMERIGNKVAIVYALAWIAYGVGV